MLLKLQTIFSNGERQLGVNAATGKQKNASMLIGHQCNSFIKVSSQIDSGGTPPIFNFLLSIFNLNLLSAENVICGNFVQIGEFN